MAKLPILAELNNLYMDLENCWRALKPLADKVPTFAACCKDIESFFDATIPNWKKKYQAEAEEKFTSEAKKVEKGYEESVKKASEFIPPKAIWQSGLKGPKTSLGTTTWALVALAGPASAVAAMLLLYSTSPRFRADSHKIFQRGKEIGGNWWERLVKWKRKHTEQRPRGTLKPASPMIPPTIGPTTIGAVNTAIIALAAYSITKELAKTAKKVLSPAVFIAAAIVAALFFLSQTKKG